MLYFLQQLLNGLHMGAIYALLAFGYALINAVLHRTNLAHGAIFGFGGQIMILAAVYRLAGSVADASGNAGVRRGDSVVLRRGRVLHPFAQRLPAPAVPLS